MVVERTYTGESKLNPEGEYRLTVFGVPEKRTSGKSSYRIWTFADKRGGFIRILLMPWESKELLLALGGKEMDDGSVEWDDEKVMGKKIDCELYHMVCNDGKTREKLRNITKVDLMPAPENMEGVKWNE